VAFQFGSSPAGRMYGFEQTVTKVSPLLSGLNRKEGMAARLPGAPRASHAKTASYIIKTPAEFSKNEIYSFISEFSTF